MAIEKTLVLLKPCTLQRGLVGEILGIFERKGLHLCGLKMMQLTDELLSEHYAHLSEKPFFQRVKDSMMTAPVIAVCLAGVDAIAAVRALAGPTNGRTAAHGTIRGSYCMSFQENIVHASDGPETAAVELKRFFKPEEIFDWKQCTIDYLYANDEFCRVHHACREAYNTKEETKIEGLRPAILQAQPSFCDLPRAPERQNLPNAAISVTLLRQKYTLRTPIIYGVS